MLAIFARIKPVLRKSITFDNDTAFAQHGLLQSMRAMATWFCDAYASWQKGGVENANGRLRRWLPRHIDIDRLSDEEIQDIVITANLTPRKCLGFKTPFQAIPLRFAPESTLTLFENIMIGQKLSEYHTGYRAWSRAVLEKLPLRNNSEDFVFDNQMLAQSAYFGFRIGEVSCPTKYFPEASAINFRGSVRLPPPHSRSAPSACAWPVVWPGWWWLASSQRGSRSKGQPVPRQGCFEFSAVSVHRNCHLRGFADFRCGERHIAGIAAGRGCRRDLWAGAWLPPSRDQCYGGCRPCVFSQQIPVPSYGLRLAHRRSNLALGT